MRKHPFLRGGGEMAQLIASFDWAATPIGAIAAWPQSLKTATAILLRSPVPIVMLWGVDGIMLYNDAYSAFAADRHPDLLGMKVREAWSEVAEFNDNVMKVGLAGGTLAYKDQELTLVRHGRAEQAWMNLDYSPVLDEAGEPAGVIAIVIETTGRVLAERRQAEAVERQRLMFQQAPGYLCTMTGPDHVFDFLNDAHKRLFGERDAVGKTVREAFPELAGQGFYELLDQVYATGQRYVSYGAPVRLRRTPDGMDEELVLDFVYEPVTDEAGRVIGIFNQGNDVTERHRAEESLRRSEEQLRLATDAAEIGLWDLDPESGALYWPPIVKAMFGIPPDRSISMADFYSGLHPDDHDRTVAAFVAALDPALRGIYDVEYRTIGQGDGAIRWVAAKGRAVFDDAGKCVRVIGTAIDITSRKATEEKLRELNETLEQRVAEEVAERGRAEAALRQAHKMEAMGQLTGGVAHDFNNLLTPIVGSLDMLQRKGVGSEREQRLIAGAAQSAERAKVLVQRLLAFARRQPLQSVAVDVCGLVAGMADLIASTSGPQIKVMVDIGSNIPPAQADPNQLEMALLNLGVNARDAMPEGGTLRVSVKSDCIGEGHATGLVPGGYVRLSVADTGIGMDQATMARAIEPFFSTKGIGQGTGLGLSMVHGLASQLGGALTIESHPGAGTNIELWLPVSAEAARPVPSPTMPDTSTLAGIALLVDDEELVRMTTADMLAELGYAVVEASSAEQALVLIDEGVVPDIVITDHLMPGMSGTDLARAARDRFPNLRVLVVSGYADLEGISPDLPRLTKPFRASDLAQSLTQLLDKQA